MILLLLLAPPALLSSLLLDHTSNRLYAVAASYILHLASLATSTVVYRLSPLHPLASYPGPLMCKVSKWWMVWQTRGGVQHLWIQQLHHKYGDAIRIGIHFPCLASPYMLNFITDIGPNELSFSDPSIIAPLMGATGLPKGPGRLMQAKCVYISVEILFAQVGWLLRCILQ
jgi:hypothetical protein